MLFGVDDMLRLGNEGCVDRDDIGDLEKFGHGHHLDTQLGCPLLGDERVIGNAFHIHCICPLRHFPSNPPETDDTERLLVQFDAHELRALPFLLLQARGCLRDVAGEREHHCHRVLGCRKGVALRRIGDDDPFAGCCIHIDIVHTDTGTPDELEPFCLLRSPLRLTSVPLRTSRAS